MTITNTANLSPALFTDLYELTMAQAYWQAGITAPACFSLFVRRLPTNRGYLIFAGIDDMLTALADLRFTPADITALRGLDLFDHAFIDYLADLRFTGSARAIPEGSIFFANEPVIEITAPVIQAQLAETILLNHFNAQTMHASKAARVVTAAAGRTVVDFAARRTHGIDSANKFARAAYIAGFAGTSNVLASRQYGIPAVGTMAHSFITAFPTEQDAFAAYTASFPHNSTLLVDTYDTIRGIQNAITAAKRMQRHGHNLNAIRLDSGDLVSLSREARAMLNAAGLSQTQVIASGGLDEYEIARLLSAGAAIDGFGVGTNVGSSADYPWLDCVYKMVEYDGKPTMKLSADKETLVGAKQVFRRTDADGMYIGDAIGVSDEPPPHEPPSRELLPLLAEVMSDGVRLTDAPALPELRRRTAQELARLRPSHKQITTPAEYPVSITPTLQARQQSAKSALLRRIQQPDRHP